MTEVEDRAEQFRQHAAEQLMRQTAALERIVSILQLLVFLLVAGGIVAVGVSLA